MRAKKKIGTIGHPDIYQKNNNEKYLPITFGAFKFKINSRFYLFAVYCVHDDGNLCVT